MKPRSPKSFAAAVTRIRSKLGEGACAEVVGRSASLVRKWADPDHHSVPNLEQALLLDQAYIEHGFGKPPLLELYGEQLAGALKDRNIDEDPIDMLITALTVQGVVGDLSEAIREAISETGDGGQKITPRERMNILEILERLDAQMEKIEDAVEDE